MIFDSITKIVVFSIVSVLMILVLKPYNNHLSILLTLTASIVIFLFISPLIAQIIELFNSFSSYVDYDTLYLDTVLKIICVSYICEIAVELCKDAGVNSIATKIEMSGKVLIMILSIPIISEVLKTVITIL